MKKLLFAVLAVAVLSGSSFAGGWGLDVKLGGGQNDPKGMKESHELWGGTLTKGGGYFAIEGLYEWDLGGETLETVGSANKLGLRFGIEGYGENKLESTTADLKETTAAFPISVYYRRDGGIKAPSFYVGGGITYFNTEVKVSPGNDIEKNKVVPHVMAGAEYRFTKLFALGLDLKYNFNAKMTKNDVVISDRSGFIGALAGRFYF